MSNLTVKSVCILAFLVTVLHGGIGEAKFSVIVEGRGGLFRPDTPNFTNIYDESDLITGAALGMGYKNTFLMAKYKLFETKGESIVKGIDLEGAATWRQEFISLGLRSYAQKLFYVEIAYVVGSVEESISTNEPVYTALNAAFSRDNIEGASVAAGINVPIAMGLNLSGEMEYLFVQMPSPDQSNGDKINIGGPAYGLGISLVF